MTRGLFWKKALRPEEQILALLNNLPAALLDERF